MAMMGVLKLNKRISVPPGRGNITGGVMDVILHGPRDGSVLMNAKVIILGKNQNRLTIADSKSWYI